MNMQNLFVKAIQRDMDALAELIEVFRPTISKYTRWLNYDTAETDLIISFIETVYGIDSFRAKNFSEGQIVAYLSRSIKNTAIDLHRSYLRDIHNQAIHEEYILEDHYPYFSAIYFDEMLKDLTSLQRFVIKCKFLMDLSDIEISQALKTSRQSVNRIYNRALKKLRKQFYE